MRELRLSKVIPLRYITLPNGEPFDGTILQMHTALCSAYSICSADPILISNHLAMESQQV